MNKRITIPGVAPDMIANNLTPFEPTHPGELIRQELMKRGLTQVKLASQLDISASLLNEVLKGKRGINTELALMMEAALDIPAEMLLNLQGAYNMQMAKSNASFMKKLAAIRKLTAVL